MTATTSQMWIKVLRLLAVQDRENIIMQADILVMALQTTGRLWELRQKVAGRGKRQNSYWCLAVLHNLDRG